MGYWTQKRLRASSKSGKCYIMEGGKYAPIIRFRFTSVNTSQLTTFGLWKRVNSNIQPWVQSWTTRPNPPYAPTAAVMITHENTMSYPSLLQQ